MSRVDVPTLLAAVPVTAPTEIERSTGTSRRTDKFQHWDRATQAAILDSPEATSGQVVIVLVAPQSAVVGPFASPQDALAWWNVPFNTLRRQSCVDMRLHPVTTVQLPLFDAMEVPR